MSDEYVRELKEKMKQSMQQLRLENDRESEQACHLFLQSSYQCIERKLKNREY